MSAYRTVDPTARIEQLEGENTALRLKVDVLAELLAMSVGEDAGHIVEPKKDSKSPLLLGAFLVSVLVAVAVAIATAICHAAALPGGPLE